MIKRKGSRVELHGEKGLVMFDEHINIADAVKREGMFLRVVQYDKRSDKSEKA